MNLKVVIVWGGGGSINWLTKHYRSFDWKLNCRKSVLIANYFHTALYFSGIFNFLLELFAGGLITWIFRVALYLCLHELRFVIGVTSDLI